MFQLKHVFVDSLTTYYYEMHDFLVQESFTDPWFCAS